MLRVGGYKSGRVAEAESLRPEEFAVAGATVDLLVGAVAGEHRVEWPVALGAVEALLVPHRALGELLLGGEYHAAAARAALAGWRLDGRRVRVVEWPASRDLVLTGIKRYLAMEGCLRVCCDAELDFFNLISLDNINHNLLL